MQIIGKKFLLLIVLSLGLQSCSNEQKAKNQRTQKAVGQNAELSKQPIDHNASKNNPIKPPITPIAPPVHQPVKAGNAEGLLIQQVSSGSGFLELPERDADGNFLEPLAIGRTCLIYADRVEVETQMVKKFGQIPSISKESKPIADGGKFRDVVLKAYSSTPLQTDQIMCDGGDVEINAYVQDANEIKNYIIYKSEDCKGLGQLFRGYSLELRDQIAEACKI